MSRRPEIPRRALEVPAEDAGVPVQRRCVAEPGCLAMLLELVGHYCARLDIDPQDRHDLRLIVEEACANVIAHAYPVGKPGPLSLQLQAKRIDGRRALEITVEDEGISFNPLALPAPDRSGPLAELPIGGLGVHLIRQLSDVQHYRRDPRRGNVLTIGKFLKTAAHE